MLKLLFGGILPPTLIDPPFKDAPKGLNWIEVRGWHWPHHDLVSLYTISSQLFCGIFLHHGVVLHENDFPAERTVLSSTSWPHSQLETTCILHSPTCLLMSQPCWGMASSIQVRNFWPSLIGRSMNLWEWAAVYLHTSIQVRIFWPSPYSNSGKQFWHPTMRYRQKLSIDSQAQWMRELLKWYLKKGFYIHM